MSSKQNWFKEIEKEITIKAHVIVVIMSLPLFPFHSISLHDVCETYNDDEWILRVCLYTWWRLLLLINWASWKMWMMSSDILSVGSHMGDFKMVKESGEVNLSN